MDNKNSMKLSFSLASKSNPKSSHDKNNKQFDNDDHTQTKTKTKTLTDSSSKQYVTEFDAAKTLNSSRSNHVIPPIQNEWQPLKKMKNINLPMLQSDGSRALQFELEQETESHQEIDDNISFGLNIRRSTTNNEDEGINKQRVQSAPPVETMLLEKLKNDLDRLPEHRGMEEFEDMPVEGFGAALLAGYGWYEGRGIGRNAKEDVKVKQIKKRTAKEGLGFDLNQEKHKNSKRVDDGDGFFVGKDVRVIGGGRDLGLKGTIVDKLDSDWVVLKLITSQEEVKVRVVDIADLGSKEEDKCLRKLKEVKIQQDKKSRQSRRRDTEKRGSREIGEVKVDRESVSWLRSHIRVRVISKDLKGGKLYLKKGEVVDVVGPTNCDISMDESRELIQGVDQKLLETALPPRGGPVLVLNGKHKGVYGNLVERDLDRETGVVRDADSHELLNVQLEQIAEYIGDPSYLGF